jgi:hypothetical protein
MRLELDFATNDGLSKLFDRQPLNIGVSKTIGNNLSELRLEEYDKGAGFGFGEIAVVALTFAGSVFAEAAKDAVVELVKKMLVEMFQFGQGLVIRKITDENGNTYECNEKGLAKLALEYVKFVEKNQKAS